MKDSQKITLLTGLFVIFVTFIWYGPVLIPMVTVSLTTVYILCVLGGNDARTAMDSGIATMLVMFTVLIGLGIFIIYFV